MRTWHGRLPRTCLVLRKQSIYTGVSGATFFLKAHCDLDSIARGWNTHLIQDDVRTRTPERAQRVVRLTANLSHVNRARLGSPSVPIRLWLLFREHLGPDVASWKLDAIVKQTVRCQSRSAGQGNRVRYWRLRMGHWGSVWSGDHHLCLTLAGLSQVHCTALRLPKFAVWNICERLT